MISLKKFNALSDKERRILTDLGLAPKKEYRPKSSKVVLPFALEEYTLGIVFSCGTCKGTSIEVYRMIPQFDPEEPYLKSEEEDPSKIPDKLQHKWRPTCGECRLFLKKKTKDELAQMVIDMRNGRDIMQSWGKVK